MHLVLPGGDVVQQLRVHLTEVQGSATKAASSCAELRKMAKQHARGLLKITQTGLRNNTGGSGELALHNLRQRIAIVLCACALRFYCIQNPRSFSVLLYLSYQAVIVSSHSACYRTNKAVQESNRQADTSTIKSICTWSTRTTSLIPQQA